MSAIIAGKEAEAAFKKNSNFPRKISLSKTENSLKH